ncbi:MAG: nitrous oxide reductase accessory protein NosL [Candidatus Omnitrophica bacterium]|nr:nitrous oxide reductase accessory protein NosL [Candidatus Omnitrophota bacterium]
MGRLAAPWLASGLLLAGCQERSSARPPAIRYGEEPCAQCRMLIGDARYAAALVPAAGEAKKFDDIGCLIRYQAQHPEPSTAVWVRAYRADEWLAAEEAAFVHSAELATPMGSGLVALAADEDAAQVGREMRGEVVRFEELPAIVLRQ